MNYALSSTLKRLGNMSLPVHNLLSKSLEALRPPPLMNVSEWANEYRILSSESSAEPGKYRTERTPYLQEIMNCINDHKVKIVVFMKSAQVRRN